MNTNLYHVYLEFLLLGCLCENGTFLSIPREMIKLYELEDKLGLYPKRCDRVEFKNAVISYKEVINSKLWKELI